jgi:hypothetical protein
VASPPHMRPGAVRVATLNAPASTNSHSQANYSNVCVVRDEEAAGSNPATLTQERALRQACVVLP